VLLEPFVMAGARVRPGSYPHIEMADVAPTVAVLLGTNIPASTQGRALIDVLDLSDSQKTAIRVLSIRQQEHLYSELARQLGFGPATTSMNQGQGLLDEIPQAIDFALSRRLQGERMPRLVLGIALALILAAILLWRRSERIAWLLAGGLLYAALFNFGYAVLAGRTYSLSSISSPNDIILFTAGTGAASLALAWMGLSYALNWFKSSPSQATGNTLALTFITLYLLSLPILWSFALNGAFVTWTLPDMVSMFLGFLSTLQALVVAAAGLVLSAISALIARINQNRWPRERSS